MSKDMIVVYMGEGVTDYAVGQFLSQELSGEYWESYTHEITHKYHVVNRTSVPNHKADVVMSCVDDHINNVANEDLEVAFLDQFCASKSHVLGNTECYASLDSCDVVDAYESEYHADGYKVQLVYIRQA